MSSERNYYNDIRTCIKRFYVAENNIKKWMNQGGGNMDIVTYLNLEGDTSLDLPRHPYLDYSKSEKEVFRQCFGKPLVVPKDFFAQGKNAGELINMIAEKRDLMRECVCLNVGLKRGGDVGRFKPPLEGKRTVTKKKTPKENNRRKKRKR